MSNEISRGRVALQENVIVETSVGSCEPIANQNASLLMVKLTSGTTTTVDIYGSPTKNGTYLLMAFNAADLTCPVATDRWNVLPSASFAAPWIKLVGDAAGVVSIDGKA